MKLDKPDNVTQAVWDDFIILRKAKRAPLTQTALNRIIKEAEKAKMTLETVLEECCLRGWQGFKAEWMVKIEPEMKMAQHHQPRQKQEPTKVLSLVDNLAALREARNKLKV